MAASAAERASIRVRSAASSAHPESGKAKVSSKIFGGLSHNRCAARSIAAPIAVKLGLPSSIRVAYFGFSDSTSTRLSCQWSGCSAMKAVHSRRPEKSVGGIGWEGTRGNLSWRRSQPGLGNKDGRQEKEKLPGQKIQGRRPKGPGKRGWDMAAITADQNCGKRE